MTIIYTLLIMIAIVGVAVIILRQSYKLRRRIDNIRTTKIVTDGEDLSANFEILNMNPIRNLIIEDFGFFNTKGLFISLDLELSKQPIIYLDTMSFEIGNSVVEKVLRNKSYFRFFSIRFVFIDNLRNEYYMDVSKKALKLKKE